MTEPTQPRPFDRLRRLTAGPMSMQLDEASGMLRYVHCGETEILRGIYVAVRDRNWDTVRPDVSQLVFQPLDDGGFRVTFCVDCRRDEIDFGWQAHIEATGSGSLCYRMEGKARSSFLRNRIGICVLHPIATCAGRPCQIRQVSGNVVESQFPHLISPHQPFTEMRSIRHEVNPDIDVEVRFEGEVFEMEDQRNWTDASYKTYGTPLEFPFPVTVPEGTYINQSVHVTLHGLAPNRQSYAIAKNPNDRMFMLPKTFLDEIRVPPIGLCTHHDGIAPTERQIERLQRLRLSHLRVCVSLDRPNWIDQLASATEQAAQLNAQLDVAIRLSDQAEAELPSIAEQLSALRVNVATCYVFHRDEKSTRSHWIQRARELLNLGNQARVVMGTDAYFAELNRARPDIGVADAVAYSINPQVHAADDRSLIETLSAQADTVESARSFCGDLPVYVGPITLRPRFNPNATSATSTPPGELPTQVDPRQCGLLAAAWTLNSIAQLAWAGAARLTYFETVGWRGLMELEAGCALPDRFPSVADGVFPVYHLFADLASFIGQPMQVFSVGDPIQLGGILVANDTCYRWIVANLSTSTQKFKLPSISSAGDGTYVARLLNPSTLQQAVRDPEAFRSTTIRPLSRVRLSPYALATIDLKRQKEDAL